MGPLGNSGPRWLERERHGERPEDTAGGVGRGQITESIKDLDRFGVVF